MTFKNNDATISLSQLLLSRNRSNVPSPPAYLVEDSSQEGEEASWPLTYDRYLPSTNPSSLPLMVMPSPPHGGGRRHVSYTDIIDAVLRIIEEEDDDGFFPHDA